ncbi:tol-pal system protein YbgF [Nitrosomonas sp.]|uniref:tol-pal system protein YbgF n=1 Tax=Nitrosomonas sp. TaxID=42353 RepID=UPI00260C2770|nr:tol-pal system protein YbgF [Nitrosomonas sp.]
MLIRAFLLLLLMSGNAGHAALFGDDEAREQISALRKQVSEMEARIAKMEQALNSQALLELYAKVETLGLELGKLNGQVEMLSNDNSLLQKRQRDFYIDLDNRLREIEQPNKRTPSSHPSPKSSPQSMVTPPPNDSVVVPSSPAAAAAMPEPAATEETVAVAQPDSGTLSSNELTPPGPVENNAYKEAFNLFKNGDYASAIAQFENFLESYPQSSLAPGAAYWIGNARYALRDYQLAIDAQKRLINKYPDSLKAPDAFLNMASSQYEMGDSKASKHTLEDLVAKYPSSDAAKKAKQRLANFK